MRARPCAVGLALIATGVLASSAQARPFPGWRANPDYFATPSGKTVCEYAHLHGRFHVECVPFTGKSTRDHKTGIPGFLDWGVHPHGRAYKYVLVANPPVEAKRARYDVTYRYHGIRCRINKWHGIRCTNRDGHGFRVSLQKQKRF